MAESSSIEISNIFVNLIFFKALIILIIWLGLCSGTCSAKGKLDFSLIFFNKEHKVSLALAELSLARKV